MKKSLKLFLAIFIVMIALTGCGSKKEEKENNKVDLSAYAGTYVGEYTKLVGSDLKETDKEFSLVLNADGTGQHNRNDYSFNVTWSVDGDKFEMKETFVGDPIIYTGTIKDGKLDIFNGDKEDIWTYEYVYHKK